MLEETIKIEKTEKKEFLPIPDGVYTVEFLDINLKDAKGKFAKPGEKNFSCQFTLLDGEEDDKSLRGRNLWSNFVPTSLYMGKKGKNELYQVLEAFSGHELSSEEEAKMDSDFLTALIGKQCKVMVMITANGDKFYNKIVKYSPVKTTLIPLTAEEKENAKVKTVKKELEDDKEKEFDELMDNIS